MRSDAASAVALAPRHGSDHGLKAPCRPARLETAMQLCLSSVLRHKPRTTVLV